MLAWHPHAKHGIHWACCSKWLGSDPPPPSAAEAWVRAQLLVYTSTCAACTGVLLLAPYFGNALGALAEL